MASKRVAAAAAVVALTAQEASAIDNGLGLTPPMGWRSWNLYGADVNQSLLTKIMDGMVVKKRMVNGRPTSLCDLGYCDVGLDDNWQKCGAGEDGYHYHDHEGRPIVNTDRFPNMTAMTEHAHKLGLTAGWYGNNCICAESKEPTAEMYQQDVHFLTDVFQFDAVKLDGCGKQLDLDTWANLINKTGRKVMIENCHWGGTVPTATWCPWNFFRTSGDVRASYSSIVGNLQTTIQWAQKGLSRPGCWGYPDMLEVGCQHGPGGASDPGLTPEETRSHFGAWCIVSSPLTLSHDVHNDTIMDAIWPVIANTEAIAVNQAWAGHSGSPFKQAAESVTLQEHVLGAGKVMQNSVSTPSWQYFYKPVGGGKVAVLLMNHDSKTQTLKLDFADVPGLSCKDGCEIRDIWSHQDLPASASGYSADVASHDSAFLLLSPKDLDIWADLINKTGRKVMIENCHWGHTVPTANWCPWNFFRTSGDIHATYASVANNLQTTITWAQQGLSRPGCWGYPDMLEVGCQGGHAKDVGLTAAETRSHFGAWCIVSAPLTLSHDVNNDTLMDALWPVIANVEAIAVNQAWAGHSGSPFKQATENVTLLPDNASVPLWQYFYKPVGEGKVAVLMMNHGPAARSFALDLAEVPGLRCPGRCQLRDVWAQQDLPPAAGSYSAEIGSHDCKFLVLSPEDIDMVELI